MSVAAAPTTAPTARSTDRLRLVALALASIGVAIAAYLTYVHYAGIKPVCGSGGCEKVQSSQWAKLAGVPVALIGLIGYVGILGLVAAVRSELGRALAAGAAWIGVAFSYYLQYRSVHDVHEHCVWCMGSAAVMTLLTVVLTARYLLSEPDVG